MRGLIAVLMAWSLVAAASERSERMPHLMPDAGSRQIFLELLTRGYSPFSQQNPLLRTPIDDAVDLGVRNLNWLNFINSRRPDQDKISLSSPATTNGHPIEKPSEYSPKIVGEKFAKLKAEMPAEMSEVLFGGKDFTPDLPLEKEVFIEWGLKADSLYQTALRWRLLEPWLSYLEEARREDVRGFYYFEKMDPSLRAVKLQAPGSWSEQEKADFSDWLVGMCLNANGALKTCRSQIETEVAAGNSVLPFFHYWRPASVRIWASFFRIQNARTDTETTDTLMEFPFRDPQDETVGAFLRDNIEDEWRYGAWKLKMNFTPNARAYVVFLPGVTPNVNGLGGDRITMNADQPLSEYDAQWTIRHEFGHVLGLPDCYVEFYDVERQSIMNYQLDIDNLMCSRRGRIQQKHVEELLRAY